jgi:hypothetical protein
MREERRLWVQEVETTGTHYVQCYLYTLLFVITGSSLIVAQEGPKNVGGKL